MKNALLDLLKYKQQNPGLENEETVSNFLQEGKYLDLPTWSKKDIKVQARKQYIELTKNEVREVADLLSASFDANSGINWDVISGCINEVKGN